MRIPRTFAALLSVTTLGAFAACSPTMRSGNGNGDGGTGDTDGGSDINTNGDGGANGCSAASQFVYVVDEDNTLSSFNPATKTFTAIGDLSCPATDFTASPFSMGVDRNANAYVLYSDGELFQVTGIAAGTLHCAATSWSAPTDFANFGMGFSTTTAGGTTDQLFVAGGAVEDPTQPIDTSAPAKLQTIDVNSYTATAVGEVTGWPELTGTSAAELWGFFPDTTAPRIDQINKTSGAALTTYSLKALKGDPAAWAFAAYGGDLWVFLALEDDLGDAGTTMVYQIGGPTDAAPGTVKSTTPTADGTLIVGAGVSTCAPTVLQ